ncbi:DUF2283 domain-containing protein [bacterium]|jgi:uncharacterized protein YuzE|nr:DUF2283 domain-containing protein [bacterium]
MKKLLEVDLSVSDDIAYISFCEIKAGDSVKQIEVNIPNGIVIFDLNLDGKIIGMEFINALALLPEDVRIAELEDWDSNL